MSHRTADMIVRIRRELADQQLTDTQPTLWSDEEIAIYLLAGMRELSAQVRLIWDTVYLDNIPRSFSNTQQWESDLGLVDDSHGVANFTYEEEREFMEGGLEGPANHTGFFEASYLADIGAAVDIPAVSQLPASLTEIDRATYDSSTIVPLNHSRLAANDPGYETTRGEVFGYVWRKDGIRAFRKVRVPITPIESTDWGGPWGILRNLPNSIPPGGWGTARRVVGHPPQRGGSWGVIRRLFLDAKNVKVEYWRTGEMDDIPEMYADYLRLYAKWKCLTKRGAGQDLKLAANYRMRWERAVMRTKKRVERINSHRVGRMGGNTRMLHPGPPRPRLPWQYGEKLR